MKRLYVANLIINAVGLWLSIILPLLYEARLIDFSAVLILALVLAFFMGVLPWLISLDYIPFKRRKFDDILVILNRFKYKNCDFLNIDEYSSNENKIRNRYNQSSFFRKPIVFYQQRFKPHINYVDMLYIHLLAELYEIGYKVVLLIHDFPYETSISEGKMSAHAIRVEYKHDLRRLERNIRNIIGSRCTILNASKFQASHGEASKFVELIHTRFIPFFANNHLLFTVDPNGKQRNKYEITQWVRNFFGFSTLYLLPKEHLVFYLTCDNRKDIWQQKKEILGEKANEIFIISGRTISDRSGVRINMNDEHATVNFTDTNNDLKRKIEVADVETLRTICQSILYPKEDTEIWNEAFLRKQVYEGIVSYKKARKIKEHV